MLCCALGVPGPPWAPFGYGPEIAYVLHYILMKRI